MCSGSKETHIIHTKIRLKVNENSDKAVGMHKDQSDGIYEMCLQTEQQKATGCAQVRTA